MPNKRSMAPINNMDMVVHDLALHASWQTADPLASLDTDLSAVQLVLLNGPPRSGKDTLATLLRDAVADQERMAIIPIADHLKTLTHAFYGLPPDTPPKHFEACKDEPSDLFFGLTPRQAYIFMHDKVIKPLHGPRFLGYIYARKIATIVRDIQTPLTVICPDSGCSDENLPALEKLPYGAACLVRIHKKGCDYDGDNRGYFSYKNRPDLGVREFDIENPDGDPAAMLSAIWHPLRKAASCRRS